MVLAKDTRPGRVDQFNSIHEKLIEAWARDRPRRGGQVSLRGRQRPVEDYMTVTTCATRPCRPGLTTEYLDVEDIGWNDDRRRSSTCGSGRSRLLQALPVGVDAARAVRPHLPRHATRWLEPPWKMILSNKAILPVLWELFPESPYLLPAVLRADRRGSYVRKPMLGREGANVASSARARRSSKPTATTATAVRLPGVAPLPEFDGKYPVVGSWMVNGYACGIGIREDDGADHAQHQPVRAARVGVMIAPHVGLMPASPAPRYPANCRGDACVARCHVASAQ